MLRTIWGDNDRYLRTYWEKFQNRYYVAGDSAHRDADGYYWIMGRIDDVLNVAGHRLGTMEIESALVAHPRVAEAAVVSRQHEIKGESVFAFVVTNGRRPTGGEAQALVDELRGWVAEQLSPIAKPDEIRLTDNLPKTRSGKIMRRLLRSIARGEEIIAGRLNAGESRDPRSAARRIRIAAGPQARGPEAAACVEEAARSEKRPARRSGPRPASVPRRQEQGPARSARRPKRRARRASLGAANKERSRCPP